MHPAPGNEKMDRDGHVPDGSLTVAVNNPFRPGWSLRLGRLRLRSVPWYWSVLRDRLATSTARRPPVTPPPAHHEHYCEDCDQQWVHEGHTCAHSWAFPCLGKDHGADGGRGRFGSWLIVVRRDRAELSRHLGESFAADPRVTVVVDRRRLDRRAMRARRAAVALERRRRRDRRVPQTGEESSVWTGLGVRILPARSPTPR
jgi:hypothetical protein